VIVRATPGHADAARLAVTQLGGTIQSRLGIINGFSAKLPASAVARLRGLPGVVSVTRNRVLRPQSSTYNAATDMGSMLNVSQMTGAQAYWQAGYTGAGVDVALIDSGVAPVDGLTVPGKVINGPDLSFESQASNLIYLDTFGHGTFMAGLIAGRASAAVPGTYATDATNYLGMAPDARIVSVKVADAYGLTDVSQVIAAIDWVVQHKNDNGLNIRVLNLSYGTASGQGYLTDPLAYAAEQAWKQGIFVVAAAGNAGFAKNGSMIDPAYDPMLMAVGALDTMGTLDPKDDRAATFSASGTNDRTVDLLAPGTHIVGLRDPGSFIDLTYGTTGYVTDSLFRGSGSSEAAAIVSGAAALVLQQQPNLTPDQLKAMLRQTAAMVSGPRWQGKGALDLTHALTFRGSPTIASYVPGTGTGSLELSRGSEHLVMGGITLTGEQDIFGAPFVSAAMAALEAAGNSWSGGVWNGNSWSGNSWSGNSWSGNSWSGNSWSGNSWSGNSWSGNSWSGNSWSGNSWSGNSWSGNSWSGNSWSGNSWSGNSWSDYLWG
jgi:serine protease AprX